MTKQYKQTDFVDLVEPKRPRGRPKSENALSNAERKRRYRDKLRGDAPKRPRGRPSQPCVTECAVTECANYEKDLQNLLDKIGRSNIRDYWIRFYGGVDCCCDTKVEAFLTGKVYVSPDGSDCVRYSDNARNDSVLRAQILGVHILSYEDED